jgi:hypothetical protein
VSTGSARLTMAVGVAASLLTLGCGGGREATRESQPRADEPPSVASDPSAERRTIRLTGCVKPDATPGRFVLASVATAGVSEISEDREKPRSWAAEGKETTNSQGAAMAASTYQLLPGEDGEDESLAQYKNKRVTVSGRLAAETPTGTSGTAQSTEAEGRAQTDATGAKVTAEAPPLRGVYVESITKVSDSCTD